MKGGRGRRGRICQITMSIPYTRRTGSEKMNRKIIHSSLLFLTFFFLLSYLVLLIIAINKQEYHAFLVSYTREIMHIAKQENAASFEACITHLPDKEREKVQKNYDGLLIRTPTGFAVILEKRKKSYMPSVLPDVVVHCLDDAVQYKTNYRA